MMLRPTFSTFFFFNDTATTEIYTLSLHDALPIWRTWSPLLQNPGGPGVVDNFEIGFALVVSLRPPRAVDDNLLGQILGRSRRRSEEHTSELQSRQYLVCRLLLEKKKKNIRNPV